jgi:hypothetical protein
LDLAANVISFLAPGKTQPPDLVAPVKICPESEISLPGSAPQVSRLPQPVRLAALGTTTFSGPNFFNLEASLAKSVRFTERFTLDLRLEAGVTNTPQFLSTTNGCTAGGTTLGSTSFPIDWCTCQSAGSGGI